MTSLMSEPIIAIPQRKLLPPHYFLISVLAMAGLHFGWPVMQWLHYPWTLAGAAVGVLGLFVTLSSAGLFARLGTTVRPFQESEVLVTTGFYRFTRNPMYCGLVLMLTGIALGMGSLTPWLVIPLFVWVINTRVIPVEEQMLEEKFGETYLDFKRRVRRWV